MSSGNRTFFFFFDGGKSPTVDMDKLTDRQKRISSDLRIIRKKKASTVDPFPFPPPPTQIRCLLSPSRSGFKAETIFVQS